MDDRTPQPDKRSSPWRQPVMWLVIGLPVAVVAAGIWMIVIASGDGGVDSVPEEVRRTAQIQTTDLGPDEIARAERLSAIVRRDPEAGIVEVLPVSGRFDRGAPLQLDLVHPSRENLDVQLLLQPTELGWQAAATPEGDHDWNIRLAPVADDGQPRWRLQGRMPKDQLAAHLRPRLQAQ